MQDQILSALLAYNEEDTQRWHQFFREHPEALDVPIDVAKKHSARGLVNHIFAVEYRYSQRLVGEPDRPFEDFPEGAADELFAVGAEARQRLGDYLAKHSGDLDRKITFKTVSYGTLTTTSRKMFIHAILHGVRHWAQLATALRQEGYGQPWEHDFIFTGAME
jgi:uncharacterized damage-inducible protein DinB